MLNCFKLLFSHINIHSIHHTDKAKTELSQLLKFINNKKTEISTLYCKSLWIKASAIWLNVNVHCISIHTLAWTKYLAEASLQSQVFFVWCDKLCTSSFGNDLLFFSSPLHLSSSVRLDWGRYTFSGFSTNIWLGSSSDSGWATQRRSESCVLQVIVLFEGGPSAQSEVVNALGFH